MKKHKKMERPLVASSKEQDYEVETVARKFHIPVSDVREIIARLKAEGKGYRSRKVIYQRIRERMGKEG